MWAGTLAGLAVSWVAVVVVVLGAALGAILVAVVRDRRPVDVNRGGHGSEQGGRGPDVAGHSPDLDLAGRARDVGGRVSVADGYARDLGGRASDADGHGPELGGGAPGLSHLGGRGPALEDRTVDLGEHGPTGGRGGDDPLPRPLGADHSAPANGRVDLRRAGVVVLVAVAAGIVGGVVRAVPVRAGPVAELASERAYVHLEGVIATDPSRSAPPPSALSGGDAGGPDAAHAMVRIRVERITGRGVTREIGGVAVVVTTPDPSWFELRPGQSVGTEGRLEVSTDGPVAAYLRVDGPPDVRGPPSWPSRATEPFRQGLRAAVDALAPEPRGLIPGLVIGDESLLPEQVRDDMTTTGLTHLTAVSGTNVTIVLVVALGLVRWGGVRGRAIPVLGLVTIAGFVLLARPEPSVIRAAVMGGVAVIGLTVAGRRRGLPALGTAVIVLLMADPWLAQAPGFAMSVLATSGILLLVPRWRRAMSWLPPWLAMAIAVPVAAQVACIPVLVTLSGEASLVSVPANLLAAPLVAPATILGVAAAAVAPVWSGAAEVLAWLAGWPAGGIASIAGWGAGLPTPTVPWPSGAPGVVVAVVCAVVLVCGLPWLLRRPAVAVPAAVGLVVVIVAAPSPGWPPPSWVVVACDVGQGDGFALRVDGGSAVVVDTGADPRAMQRCLDSLEVSDVPVLVLTHYDADHVLGTPGVLDGRTVGRAVVSPVGEPARNAAAVHAWLSDGGVPIEIGAAGAVYAVGPDVRLTVLWPRRLVSGESESNDASVVVLAEVHGVRVLLTGDLGPSAQSGLLAAAPGLDVDVLKVPHHGSPNQDERLLAEVGADVAMIGVGADNTYGHPAPWVVEALADSGQRVLRTDVDGTTAVVRIGSAGLGLVRSGK